MADKRIEVPSLDIKELRITLVGDTSLICHRFAEKARKEMLAKQQLKAKKGREVRDPESEIEEAYYKIPGQDGAYGFPAVAFKAAAVRAAKSVPDMAMTDARGFFFVKADYHQLVPLRYDRIEGVEDIVRIGRGVADLRYRPYFHGWEVDLEIEYNASIVSAEQIILLFDIAGFSVGVGDWRPEKDGPYGRFHVKKENE